MNKEESVKMISEILRDLTEFETRIEKIGDCL